MNIFILDTDVKRCAQYHVDKHIVKMILETTQLLNNARIKYFPKADHVYRKTHENHPASIWASANKSNFDWLCKLGLELCKEYSYRYGKIHKCQAIIEEFYKSPMKPPYGELTNFAQCMPDIYKRKDAVEAYRNYYCGDKRNIAKWSKRNIPEWWK